jgi:plastocyanin
MGLAAILFSLHLLPAAGLAGSVSGRVVLTRGNAPRPDASHVVVWVEGVQEGAPRVAPKREMASEAKRFQPRVVAVPLQNPVVFPNNDPIYHNVFSVSGANRFDLGLYRSGASKSREFTAPGLVRVYCNIHPQMVGFVMVVDSAYVAVTGPDGGFRFEGVPAGSHTLKVWHEEGGEKSIPITVRSRADSPVTLELDTSGHRPQPHKNKYGKDYPPQAGSDDERY